MRPTSMTPRIAAFAGMVLLLAFSSVVPLGGGSGLVREPDAELSIQAAAPSPSGSDGRVERN